MKVVVGAALALVAGSSYLLYKEGAQGPTIPIRDTRVEVAPGSALPFDRSYIVGTYYFGDGLGVNCTLNMEANHRFSFRWTGCMGEYDRNEGKWEVRGDTVFLHPEKENKREGFEGMNTRFVPMVWNKRLYLVDEYEAPGFCSTLDPNKPIPSSPFGEMHGEHYVRMGEGRAPSRIDLPDHIAARFKNFVGKAPIHCSVTALNKDGSVTLDKGMAAGLRPGIMLGPEQWYTGDLEVIAVKNNTATARPGYFFNSVHLVEVGDKYDTGGALFTPHGTGWHRLAKPPKLKPRDKKSQKQRGF